jgi:hypothetical protein
MHQRLNIFIMHGMEVATQKKVAHSEGKFEA